MKRRGKKLIFQIIMFYFQHLKQIRILLLTISNEKLRINTKKLWLLFSMLILTGIGRNLKSHVEWLIGMTCVGVLAGSDGTTQFNVFTYRKRSSWWWLGWTFVSMENFGMIACHPDEKDEKGNPRRDLWPPQDGTALPNNENNPIQKLLWMSVTPGILCLRTISLWPIESTYTAVLIIAFSYQKRVKIWCM